MANLNKVLLMGNLTRDPQLSYLPSQTAVVEFGIAMNRRWTSREGEKKEETCFVDCRAFGKLADTINKYMAKGRPIFLEGRLSFESWTAQDGTKRSRHRVVVENFQFLPGGGGGGGSGGGGSGGGSGGGGAPAARSEDASAPNTDESPDDIPF